MTNSMSPSLEAALFCSTKTCKSSCIEGVTYTIRRMTLGRRLELARRVREVAGRLDFHRAGESTRDQLEATVLSLEVDRLYLDWGLESISGLRIDGEPATAQSLMDAGPEGLAREVISGVKAECGLSEEERKN